MSQTNIPITQLAQLGLAERIVQEAQGHPEVAREAAQQMTPQALKQQKSTVGATEKAESARSLKAQKDGKGGRQGAGQDARRRGGEPPPEEDDAGASKPWAGNIVNVKV